MPYYQLHLDVELNNVQSLGFAPSCEPVIQFDIRCTRCSETTKNALVCLTDAHESDEDKGNCVLHYVSKCKFCKSELKVWISELKGLVKDGHIKSKTPLPTLNSHFCRIGTITEADEDIKNSKPVFNTLFAVLEARGGEICSWSSVNTAWKGQHQTQFFDVDDLTEDGFYDVNDDNEEVSVTLLKYRVQ